MNYIELSGYADTTILILETWGIAVVGRHP
jgi:hypothetical protein